MTGFTPADVALLDCGLDRAGDAELLVRSDPLGPEQAASAHAIAAPSAATDATRLRIRRRGIT